MQLIGTLAAGVVGAEEGYAKVFVRGSSKRARYYADFEGEDAIDGGDILLDANGGAVVYTNITVDVFVYGKNDQLIRRWIEASTSACVEVISQSFTGADYETGVGGTGKPTTAASVFDRLLLSFGAEDFLVKMPDGSKATLQEAIAGITSVYKNVKSPLFGATGLGLVSDRAAIQAAIDAAALDGGGVVFFPAGTYLLDTVSLMLPRTVSLVGSGAAASRLVSPSTVQPVVQTTGPSAFGSLQVIQGLGFSHNTPTGARTLDIIDSFSVAVRSCSFAVRASACIRIDNNVRLGLDDCDFTIGGAGSALDSTNMTPRTGRIDVRRCRFVMLSTGTATIILRGANIHMLGSVYDGTASLISNVVVLNAESAASAAYGSVRCCEFIDSATRPILCMGLGTISTATEWFTEDGNFLSALHASSRLYSAIYGTTVGYYCKLGTRENRISSITTAVTPVNLPLTAEFGVFNVRFTGTSNFVITPDTSAPLGARLRVLVVNGDSVTRTITFGTGTRGGSFAVGTGKMIGFEFVRGVANNGVSDVAAWFSVGTSGILTTGTDSGYAV